MTKFLIVLHLFLANGTSNDVSFESWAFESNDECAQSVAVLNKGLDPTKRAYACQIQLPADPTMIALDKNDVAKNAKKKS